MKLIPAPLIPCLGVLALAIGPSVRVQAQDALTNGLVAFYPFNGNPNDESGNGNDGAIIGYDWHYGPDRFGQTNSLYLNTTSTPSAGLDGTYVIVPRSASLDFSQDFTLSVWISIPEIVYYVHNLISNGPDQPIGGFTSGVNLRVIGHSQTNGEDDLEFICNHQDGDVQVSSAPQPNTWWQLVAVRSGTNLSLFKNGSLFTNAVMTAAISNSPAIWIGRHICPGYPTTCTGSYPLVGGIDDVRMYNRALSAQEVGQLYQYERNPLPNLGIAVKTIRLTLMLAPGTSNELDSSTDLKTWAPYGPPFVATNSITYEDVDIFGMQKQYFRVRLLTP
jgi:hypothetical protein